MKAMATFTCAACLLGLLSSPVLARKTYTKHVNAVRHGAVHARYPYASARQQRNAYAFENGGYYETDYSAHAFGSRGWWMLQQRGGGRR